MLIYPLIFLYLFSLISNVLSNFVKNEIRFFLYLDHFGNMLFLSINLNPGLVL